MDNKNRHIKGFWSSRIYDYLFGSLQKGERNALEREEQSDMFFSDALSGLAGMSGDEYQRDMKDLHERLNTVSNSSGGKKWIAVAATILFIAGVSSLLFLLIPQETDHLAQNRQEQSSEIENINNNSEEDMPESVTNEAEISSESVVAKETSSIMQVTDDKSKDRSEASPKKQVMLNIVDDDTELYEELEVSESEMVEDVQRKKAVPKAVVRSAKYNSDKVEYVEESLSPVKIENRSAEPQMGMEKYREVIKAQIRELLKGKKMKITIKLTISNEGNIVEVEILKSSAKSFNNEIKRIVKNGPVWYPAYLNGFPVKDKVKIKLK